MGRESRANASLVVVGVLLLVALGAGALFFLLGTGSRQGESKAAKAASDLTMLANAISTFNLECGRYPTTKEGLTALRSDPGAKAWNGPYAESLPMDPWGNAYVYELKPVGSKPFTLMSLGADGKPGGTESNADILHR